MDHLVKRRERPGSPCVLVIHHHERSDAVGYSEPAKRVGGYVGVITAEVAEKQNEYSGSFEPLSKIVKGEFD
jgi:hypothetical protein